MKTTYIYRVEYGKGNNNPEIDFCYARNARTAINKYKQKYKKYDHFKAYAVGEADFRKHPDYYEDMPQDEKKYLLKIRGKIGEKYTMKKDNLPVSGGFFVPKEEMAI